MVNIKLWLFCYFDISRLHSTFFFNTLSIIKLKLKKKCYVNLLRNVPDDSTSHSKALYFCAFLKKFEEFILVGNILYTC